jgi:hypothetical protein
MLCSAIKGNGSCAAAMHAFHVTAAASMLVIDAAHLGIEARRRRRYTHSNLGTRHDCGCGVEVVMHDVGATMMWRSAESLVRSAFWAAVRSPTNPALASHPIPTHVLSKNCEAD